MTGSERRTLMTRANTMNPQVTVGKAGLTEAVIAQIRGVLAGVDLLKIRLPKESDGDELAGQIAAGVPCEVVGRRGFTVVVTKAGDGTGGETADVAE
ncbi:MAG: YhbY family RNA-binding protein [Planctomycetes bacterium]|nr:YhbY family RNA-binding protein [Planctomycetota bacterium]